MSVKWIAWANTEYCRWERREGKVGEAFRRFLKYSVVSLNAVAL